jgi:L-lactate dehydrogenase
VESCQNNYKDDGNSKKVAIVGAGFVGSSLAYSLMLDGVVSEIAIIDKDKNKAEGHALDLNHGMQFVQSVKIVAGDSFELVKDAKIVVICAGIAQKSGQPRSALLDENVRIFKEVIPQIVKYNKDCILLIVTNPLDVLTYLAYKLSGFPACRVFGTGTVLDTARLRFLLGNYLQISPKDITAYILGEHGDSQFVWWSHANIAGVPIKDFPKCSPAFLNQIYDQVKNAVYEVINRKGATYYSIALVTSKIVRAILLNQARVFTVSTLLSNYHGATDLCLSVPTVVRASGICQKLEVSLSDEEEKMFGICVTKVTKEKGLIKNI